MLFRSQFCFPVTIQAVQYFQYKIRLDYVRQAIKEKENEIKTVGSSGIKTALQWQLKALQGFEKEYSKVIEDAMASIQTTTVPSEEMIEALELFSNDTNPNSINAVFRAKFKDVTEALQKNINEKSESDLYYRYYTTPQGIQDIINDKKQQANKADDINKQKKVKQEDKDITEKVTEQIKKEEAAKEASKPIEKPIDEVIEGRTVEQGIKQPTQTVKPITNKEIIQKKIQQKKGDKQEVKIRLDFDKRKLHVLS